MDYLDGNEDLKVLCLIAQDLRLQNCVFSPAYFACKDSPSRVSKPVALREEPCTSRRCL